ncbi:MAG: DUF427 domain-containing protein [Prochloraceae cyanobacterium]
MAKAIWNDVVLAESDNFEVVDGYHYLPEDSIKKEYFQSTETHSSCALKGQASYYTIVVDGQENKDAAWYYPNPKPGYEKIKNYVGFWKGVKVEV